MKLPKLRNAIVYSATLPDAEQLETHLLELPYSEIGENEFSRTSFYPNPVTGDILTPIAGGFAFVVRLDQKIIPVAVVRKTLKDRVASIESRSGMKVTKKDLPAIKDSVVADLCKQAFVKSTLILSLYHIEKKHLFINTTSRKESSLVCSMLVKVVGSVKTETIHISDIKNGLTTRLKKHLSGEKSAFDRFTVGGTFQLSRLADEKETIKYSAEYESVESELADSLETGFIVDSMELIHGPVRFFLTDQFHLRRINTGEGSPQNKDDPAFAWRQSAGADLFLLNCIVADLCSLLSYQKEPTEGKSE